MQPEHLLYGGALVGLLIGLWSKIKSLAWRVASRLVVRAKFEGELGKAIVHYCLTNYKKSRYGERRYAAAKLFVKPLDRFQTVGYEGIGLDTAVFWCGWLPLLVKADAHKVGGNDASGQVWTNLENLPITLTAIRGTVDLDKIACEALDLYNKFKRETTEGNRRYRIKREYGSGSKRSRMSGRGDIKDVGMAPSEANEVDQPDRRYLQWERKQLGMPSPDNPWSSLAFPPEVEEAKLEVERWLQSQKWYKDIGVAWRRGWLLQGAAGCGKTSMVRAIAQQLDLPVVVFDLTSFSNEEFVKEWHDMLTLTPCVALLEDLDCVFHGRENMLGEEGGGLTFDCLLNCLSGVESADGVLTVVTTNRPETLDEALLRPGRIDRRITLTYMDEDCRRRVAQRMLASWPELIEPTVQEGANRYTNGCSEDRPDTPAEFTDRCCRIALERYWQSKIEEQPPIQGKD